MPPNAETFSFQAETKELLDLVIHSLYTHREIFLRELVSNASDALDKLRFEALTNRELDAAASGLEIRLEPEPKARVLKVIDNGIGMTRAEVIENIGTIARSGTKKFLEALAQSGEKAALPELIGRFGVGFYSAFLVADEVELVTRKAGEPRGVRWRSKGDGAYTLEDAADAELGTSVVLHLKPVEETEGRDFTAEHELRALVRRYSDFIGYPIQLVTGSGKDRKSETLNSQKPLWTRPRDQIEEGEYAEFYRHLTHDWTEPLETIHFKAEGTTEFAALVFVPAARPLDLFDPASRRSKLSLYVRRVFITNECEELLPAWLRFLPGVVDSSDLPLNVSRETLQATRQTGQIKKRLTRKVLDALKSMQKERAQDYERFWKAFGPILKEGLYADDEFRDELAKLALFRSSAGDAWRTLEQVVADMPVKQKEIYALVATDAESAARSPHLEAFRAKGFEVLFWTDPVDEFVLQRFREFEGRPIRRVDQGEVELLEEGEKTERAARAKELAPLFEAVRKELAESISDVRPSSRLTESPACLVASENALSPQLARVLRDAGQPVPEEKRVLELNPTHPLVTRLSELLERDPARFAEDAQLVLDLARVAEGAPPADPAAFARRVGDLVVKAG